MYGKTPVNGSLDGCFTLFYDVKQLPFHDRDHESEDGDKDGEEQKELFPSHIVFHTITSPHGERPSTVLATSFIFYHTKKDKKRQWGEYKRASVPAHALFFFGVERELGHRAKCQKRDAPPTNLWYDIHKESR